MIGLPNIYTKKLHFDVSTLIYAEKDRVFNVQPKSVEKSPDLQPSPSHSALFFVDVFPFR